MDRHLPVATRTRFQQEEFFRKLLETTTKKKEKNKGDEKQKKKRQTHVSDKKGTTSDKGQDFGSSCSSGSGGRRFVVGKGNKSVTSDEEVPVKDCDIVDSLEKRRKQKARGTQDDPFCIDDDDDCSDGFDDHDNGVFDEHAFDEDDHEEEEEDDEWVPSSDEDRGTAKRRKTGKGSGSCSKLSDDEIEENVEDEFWVESKEGDETSTQQVRERNEGENESEKTNNAGDSVAEEEEEEAFLSDGEKGWEIETDLRSDDDDHDDVESKDDFLWEEVREVEEKKEEEKSELIEIEISSSSGDEKESFQLEEEEDIEDESEKEYLDSSAKNTDHVALRTRSQHGKVKKKELRNTSRPSNSEEHEEGEHSEMCERTDPKKKVLENLSAKKRKSRAAEASDKKEQELMGRGTKRKLKRKEHGYDVFRILVDSICEKGQVCVEDLVSNKDKTPKNNGNRTVLPLNFTFGVEEPKPREKTKEELEIEELWAEMDLALTYNEIGPGVAEMVENEDSSPGSEKNDKYDRCSEGREGRHQPRLDDEIGLICSCCSKVLLEIKYIVPSFEEKNPSGRSDFRDLPTSICSFFDDFEYLDSDCESYSGSDLRAHAETVWDFIPGVKRSMYPHQREGFEFIWKHIAGGIHRENFENIETYTGGEGCIISHAPGTGKSRLTIVFLQTYMKLHPKCLPVIIAPRSMLLTWEEEFRKWKVDIPFHNLNIDELSGKEDQVVLKLLREADRVDLCDIRAAKLYSWRKGGSILAVSYPLFEKLVTGQDSDKSKDFGKILLTLPGLLVLDEGHTPRNNESLIWQALLRVQTRKRILLSGTPFQNNFNELFNTMCMVKPTFLETTIDVPYCDMKPKSKEETRKLWALLTKSIGQSADSQMKRLKRIKAIIDPLVHIHRGDVLEQSLPGLRESIVVLKPFELQKSLLEEIEVERRQQFVFENAVALTSVHPSLLLETKAETARLRSNELKGLRSNPDAGVKTKFLVELIRLSTAMKERVLVFSEYLSSLSLMKEYLISKFGWTDKKEVLYIDGKCDLRERQGAINKFNDPSSEAKVVLASIKACGEGINLVGASRVVLLDVVWNPSLERQATRRAYRLGQKNVVYVYHLIAHGTMEEDKYSRQVEKKKLSKLVFSSSDSTRNRLKNKPRVQDRILQMMVQHENLKPIFERISFKQESNLMETSLFRESQPMVSSESDL